MRPGLSLSRTALGAIIDQQRGRWAFQPKLDEERAFLAFASELDELPRLFNRHGRRLPRHKEALFQKSAEAAAAAFPNAILDVGTLGFRTDALGRGGIVVYDVLLSGDREPWSVRRERLKALLRLPAPNLVETGGVYRLDEVMDGLALFDARLGEGIEGVIGRRLDGMYQQGDSDLMLKAKYL